MWTNAHLLESNFIVIWKQLLTLLSVYPRDILTLFLKRTYMWTFTLSLILVLRCWRKSKSSSLEESTCEIMLCFVRHNESCITAVQTEVKSSSDWKIRNRLRCISWYQHITKWCARWWSHNVVQYSVICRKKTAKQAISRLGDWLSKKGYICPGGCWCTEEKVLYVLIERSSKYAK